MARIKIYDLPDSMTFTKEEMENIYGGPNRRPPDEIGSFLSGIDFDLTYDGLLSSDDGIMK